MTFVLGDTDEDAREQAEIVRRQQVSGPTAMVFLEQLWNRDLSAYDPDGPLPDVDPIEGESTIAPGSIPARSFTGRRQATADELARRGDGARACRSAISWSRRAARQTFVGSAATIADQLDLHVQTHACDGFILVPHITPAGLDASPTRSCRCCRSAARSGPSTRARRCASTSGWHSRGPERDDPGR